MIGDRVPFARAAAYIAEHGEHSWEVDALPPDELSRIIRRALQNIVDDDLMNEVKAREKTDKARLLDAVQELMQEGE